MRIRPLLLLLVGLAALGSARPDVASSQVLDPIQYTLDPASVFEYGCFGPCACPVLFSGPVKGDFTFYRTSVDPLFTHYALLNITWTYTIGTGSAGTPRVVHVVGHGTYDIGGEVAAQQRMTLDITTDDTLHQQFDSGLVPVRAAFPAIDIDVQVHVNACFDSMFRVVASPFGTASVPPGAGSRLLRNLTANPARGAVELVLSPRSVGRARVEVLDVRGRVVATLLDRATVPGEIQLQWNGRSDRGAPAGPGVYWARAAADGRIDRVRIVRL